MNKLNGNFLTETDTDKAIAYWQNVPLERQHRSISIRKGAKTREQLSPRYIPVTATKAAEAILTLEMQDPLDVMLYKDKYGWVIRELADRALAGIDNYSSRMASREVLAKNLNIGVPTEDQDE